MGPEQLDEIHQAGPETLDKFQRLLERLRHLQPTIEIQRKILRGLLERQRDASAVPRR
jgi:hypothetical protein